MNVLVARRRAFSSAHFYHQEQFSEEKNLEVFGRCFTPNGHGHNYTLEVFVAGPIDPETRLVVNLADLDEILLRVTDPLDHHHLNFDIPEFAMVSTTVSNTVSNTTSPTSVPTMVPTTENIAHYLRDKFIKELALHHPTLRLHSLRLFETDNLWAEIIEDSAVAGISGKHDKASVMGSEVTLRAIHHLSHPNLSESENHKLYGLCYGEHGHHYKVQVQVTGATDPKSGLLMNRDQLHSILNENLVKPYDGADLNAIFPNTACEALTVEFYNLLKPLFGEGKLVRVGIQETKKNYFEFPV
jgi:6-pyruvoyltetrahydropterin/6-carboxytetrahydropterin synthase